MRIFLLSLQALLAISATWCGLELFTAPDGSTLGLPLGALRPGTFSDYFWPGLVLFAVLGIGHVAGFTLTLLHDAWAARAALLLGLAVLAWIIVQLFVILPFSGLQGVVMAMGLTEVLMALRAPDGHAAGAQVKVP